MADVLTTPEWMNVYKQIADEMKNIYGKLLKRVVLYGSVARGEAKEDSDIDIMVLVDASEKRLKDYAERLCDVSVDYAYKYLKVFSIIDINYSEYEEWKEILPFYKNVEQEGIVLYAA